jgi:transcriptional regulator with XRE-family HTH domain
MTVQLTPRLSTKPARFPNRIREYRLKAGLSQEALGRLRGKTRKVISAWERGLRFPAGPVLLKLAKALGTLVESLYHGIYAAFRPSEKNEKNPPTT